ncbi:MAG: 3-keto-5-aminohexanoate cleavage protein [Deltaproteobacteria bacterium]|nr:3-keto-5-aminohexanoate cleavage protein [Deltaproteobacteria bacterium]MBW2046924.1 3-keto-5-aminohexanoate cleavage protein [Deltaproteobacteria bacterium]MBW2110969.1 3-keto-5-aminohexanoate cleavage protein [Deltaproteobacteria bacterium]MBW2351721.1 3-keto-5-aminohexanoate cleavage protein [Deltaproteobacteria bacterium]
MNEQRTIITLAVTGSIGDRSKHPSLPVTPEEIAKSALEAFSAGASVVHIHVRDPETAAPSMAFELYEEAVQRIRESSNMLINLTTGAGARIVPDDNEPMGLAQGTTWSTPLKRTEHVVRLKPELCSLDVGSMNFGPRVFANPVPHVEEMAERIRKAGVKPELEVFDLGHVEIARSLMEKGLVEEPPLFQLCLGIKWGMPATSKNMLLMREALPPGAIWGGFGVGPASFPMVAQAALLGGNVRVGFEDNFYLRPGLAAESNARLVEKTVTILRALDREPASPEEAREILGLRRGR